MAEITVAKSAGFCFGVNRAVNMVYDELKKGGKVATLGPIIHNTDVVEDMQSKGVRIINEVSELLPDERVIIRSHGVGRDIYNQILKKGNEYIDATCPFVTRIHKIVSEKTAEGYFILIAGDEGHPEVQGIIGHCLPHNYAVFKDDTQLKNFFEKNFGFLEKKVAIVAQTTYNILIWGKCLDVLSKDNPNIQIFETICSATGSRQSDAVALSENSDSVIIIGGKHSSNTVKLFTVCKQYCDSVFHIENARELNTLNLFNANKIGITAGASTPAHIIKEVHKQMTEKLNDFEEDINFEEALEQSFKKIHNGERVKATIVAVNNNEAIVDVGTKHTGFVPLSELTNDTNLKPSDIVNIDDVIDLIVIKINDQEGIVTLSKKKVDEQRGFENIIKAKDEDAVIEGTVQKVVKSGVLVSCSGVQVFIPASQTGLPREEKLEVLLKQKIQLKIIEVNEARRRAVGSIKDVNKAKKAEAQKKFWETAEIGKAYTGEVKSITNYGAFVDLGGIDGMVHISELSWNRIKHPSEIVKVGDTLEVYIKDLDSEKNRISLGYKKTSDNPWEKFKNEYNVGDVVQAKIVSITPFGAFAQIIEGVDGLIHISQIANKRVDNVKDILTVGEEVDVRIIEIDIEKKRISISMRALLEETTDEETIEE